MVDIIGLLESESLSEFPTWEENRSKLITRIGHFLIASSESQIAKSFEDCLAWITANIKIERPKSQMMALMAFSIMSHFLGDVSQFKSLLPNLLTILASKNMDVVKAAVTVLKWLALELRESVDLVLRVPVETAFKWITERAQKYFFNALYIIKVGKEFYGETIVRDIRQNQEQFFEIIRGDDKVLRDLAIELVVFQQSKVSVDAFRKTVMDIWEVVQKRGSTPSLGYLILMNKLYKLRPEAFDPIVTELAKVLTELCVSGDSSVFAIAFVLDVAERDVTKFDQECVNRLCNCTYQRISRGPMPDGFMDILDKLTRVFGERINFRTLLEFVVKLLSGNQQNKVIIGYAFAILTTMIQTVPDFSVPMSIFLNVQPCMSYLVCLKQLFAGRLPAEIRACLLGFVQRGLSPRAQPSIIDLACHATRIFQLELFDTPDAMYQALKPMYVGTSELIRIEVVKAMECIPTTDVQNFLTSVATFDESKSVRKLALSMLKPSEEFALNTQILLTMHDSSFKIRRKGLKLIAQLVKYNPFDFSSAITEFVSDVLQAVVTTSDVCTVAKHASILPIVAKSFGECVRCLVPNIIDTCLSLLGPTGSEVADKQAESDTPRKLLSVVKRDGLSDPEPALFTYDDLDNVEGKRMKIYKTINAKAISQRDKCLLKTLANLGESVVPVLDQTLSAFYKILTTKKSTDLLASAVKSLSVLSMNINNGLNLRLHHQHFLPVLMKLLISTQGNEVSVAILKLFGTACDSVTSSEVSASGERELCVDLTSNSFFTDFTLRHLIPYFDNPKHELFETVGRIYDLAPKDAAKFVPLVIPMFFKRIESTDQHRGQLFEYLEIIIRQCPVEAHEFLPQLTQIQLKYFDLQGSIKLAAALSFHLMSSYVPQASVLYLPACRRIGTENRKYLKYLLKFLSFAVIFQGRPFECMLEAIEKDLKTGTSCLTKPPFMKLVVDTILCLLQSVDLRAFQARLVLLLGSILQLEQCRNIGVSLIPVMVVYLGLPMEIVENWQIMYNLTIGNIEGIRDYCSRKTASFANLPMMKQAKPEFNDYHPPNTVPLKDSSFILELDVPDQLNITKWLDMLCQKVIAESPSLVIRACRALTSIMKPFRQQIFPVAFLCYWQKAATEEEKRKFSGIVQKVISTFSQVDPFFVQLMEILDRAGCPLSISDADLARASDSRPLTLFFLQRMFMNDMKNHSTIEKLLDLNTTMGRHAAAHGMIMHAKGLLEDTTTALWSEKLGEWERALRLYGDSNADISSILRCYAHLEMWDKIKEMSDQFEKWDKHLKEENAKHFAWAYYNSGDFDKVEYYVKQFHADQHLSEVLFNGFFFLRTARYEECKQTIVKAFDLLARDTSVYMGGDAIRLHKNLHYSHMFIELQEALDILCGQTLSTDMATSLWNKRLKGFSRDSESWIRLIAIRSLVFPPREYISVYLKMISVLRKERRWKLIDTYFNRFFSQSISPTVELAQSKILWARGRKEEAIDLLQGTLNIIDMQNHRDEFLVKLSNIGSGKFYVLFVTIAKQPSFDAVLVEAAVKIMGGVQNVSEITEKLREMDPDGQKDFVIQLYKLEPKKFEDCFIEMLDSFQIDGKLEARLCRILAGFMFTACNHDKQRLTYISRLYQRGESKSSQDYKVWLGLAYTNARMIDVAPSEGDTYSIQATHAFLQATELSPSNPLEFLCQMFSIFFRIKDSSCIPPALVDRLLQLSPKAISRVIPQITIQIANPNNEIRQVVHQILYRFGEKHFQMLFYPLKLYERSDDEKKADIARTLLDNLAEGHAQEATDAHEFVEGMLRAAISWYEEWITALDMASRAYHDHNMEKMDKILRAQFQQFSNPACSFDHLFVNRHSQYINQCFKYFKEHTPNSLNIMWETFKKLFRILQETMKTLELILLPKVSEALAKKRMFAIAIPGTYSVDHPVPLLQSIEHALQVLGTQQHPRCVFMVGSDGQRRKFLLKGNQDIRLDQRVMQFFGLINSLLNKTRISGELVSKIVKYAIIPLAPNAGLISWVTGSDTLHQMIAEQRRLHSVPDSREVDMLQELARGSQVFDTMSLEQRMPIFHAIAKECKAHEIRDILWGRAPNAATWLMQNQHFTVSTALMSMVGYCIGLGDRHPSNIMVQKETGKVIHIDFGDSFEVAMTRKKYPEKVPFRLTRMIVNALDSGTVEGIFRKTCEDVMFILRESRASLVALLEIFVHEPLDELNENNRTSQTNITDRVGQKLLGKDTRLRNYEEGQEGMDVEAHVDALICEASDPRNYVLHYSGWCVFW